MASTIDSIAGPGRFGINLITGWQKAEYDQMGLWPGESHYKDRYNYLAEYATVLKELMETGVSDFKGQYLQMDDCRVSPKPHRREDHLRRLQRRGPGLHRSVCGLFLRARQGDQHARPPSRRSTTRLAAAKAKTGRDVGSYILFMIIADETDEKAMAKWQLYRDGADQGALAWLTNQAAPNAQGGTSNTNTTQLAAPESAVNLNMGTLVGLL